MKRQTTRLRELIKAGPTLFVPGCFNAMSARVLENVGFPVIYMSGYGTSLSLTGLPHRSTRPPNSRTKPRHRRARPMRGKRQAGCITPARRRVTTGFEAEPQRLKAAGIV